MEKMSHWKIASQIYFKHHQSRQTDLALKIFTIKQEK